MLLSAACSQYDTFPEAGAHAWRLAISVADLEARDATSRPGAPQPRWRRMLGCHAAARQQQAAGACMAQVGVHACPETSWLLDLLSG